MNLKRIRLTLTGWYVAVLLVIVLLTSGATYFRISSVLNSEVDNSLRDSTARLASQVTEEFVESSRSSAGQTGPSDQQEINYLTGAGGDIFFAVFSPQGEPVANPLNVPLTNFADPKAVQDAVTVGTAWRTVSLSGTRYRLLYFPARQDGQTVAVVAAGRSLSEQRSELNAVVAGLVVTSAGGLVLAVFGGLYIAGRALAPSKRAFDRQRAFVADASHELRTPLTLIRASAEAVQRDNASLPTVDKEALSDILAEADRMTVLVGELLELAGLDEGTAEPVYEVVDVGMLITEAARLARASLGARRLEISSTVSQGSLVALADGNQILRVIRALVDNAIQHTPDGGHVQVDAGGNGGDIQVSVSDTGPGLSPEDLESMFDRFYRGDKARSREHGAGLGLAIAKATVEAHRGRIWAVNLEGGGATICFTLPGRSAPE